MTSIDGAVMWPDGKVYFFSGPKYYRYDIAAEKVDDNYPRARQSVNCQRPKDD